MTLTSNTHQRSACHRLFDFTLVVSVSRRESHASTASMNMLYARATNGAGRTTLPKVPDIRRETLDATHLWIVDMNLTHHVSIHATAVIVDVDVVPPTAGVQERIVDPYAVAAVAVASVAAPAVAVVGAADIPRHSPRRASGKLCSKSSSGNPALTPRHVPAP